MSFDTEAPRLSEDEFAARFVRSLRALQRYAVTVAGDPSIGEDAVGEAYLNIVTSIGRGFGPTAENCEAYVRVAIRNEAMAVFRTRRIEITVDDMTQVVDVPSVVPAPDMTDRTWDATALRDAFAQLPARGQQVLYLVEVERVKHAVVAERLGITVNSVRVIAHRSREALRAAYLVSMVRLDAGCGRMGRARLAAYVRGTDTDRQAEAVRAHLDGCAECSAIVRHMMSLRLPVGTLVALAVLGGAGSAAVAAGFSGHSGGSAVGAAARWGMGRLRRFPVAAGITLGLGALLGVAAIVLAGTGGPESATGAWSAAGLAAPLTNGVVAEPDGDDSHAMERVEPPAELAVGQASTPDLPSASSSACRVPRALLAGAAATTASWQAPSADFRAGRTGALVTLSVSHPAGHATSAYSVQIVQRPGVTLSDLPSGCTVVGGVLTCVPTAAQRASEGFDLTFRASVGRASDAVLPTARVVG